MKTGSVFGDVIRSLRKGRKIRLHELSETTGLTVVEVSEFERGVKRPTDEQAAAIGLALGLSVQTAVMLLDARYDAALAAREAPDYRVARGCLPMAPDAEPSEVVIRRFRGG